MERCMELKQEYLCIPIQLYSDGNKRLEKNIEKKLEIFLCEGETQQKLFEISLPVGKKASDNSYSFDYYAHFPVGKLVSGLPADKPLILKLKGEDLEQYFDSIVCVDKEHLPKEDSRRPLIHFTAKTGWINDPNGLIYADGTYHMYFQYNPFNISWQNMSWGHAVSQDLLHWEQLDTVMLPDENGAIFSGSGIINERGCLGLKKDALLYFYTAAGDALEWSKGKKFTQRIAYSTDGGNTLKKLAEPFVDTISFDNRDPKVYWHEETQSYFMALWIAENDFGILTSKDMESWELTDRFTLEGAWECPDLVKLYDSHGSEQWMFWSADGYYYFGEFDGRHFKTDYIQHRAYFNKIPYAAQTYYGTEGRTISVPWLRLPNDGRLFTGAMGLPQELSIAIDEKNGKKVLVQKPVREFREHLQKYSIDAINDIGEKEVWYAEVFVNIENEVSVEISINEQKLTCMPGTGELIFDKDTYGIGEPIFQLSLLIDDNIFEVWINDGIMTGVFSLEQLKGGDRRIMIHGAERTEFYRFKV